jgi:hypothetical protein
MRNDIMPPTTAGVTGKLWSVYHIVARGERLDAEIAEAKKFNWSAYLIFGIRNRSRRFGARGDEKWICGLHPGESTTAGVLSPTPVNAPTRAGNRLCGTSRLR